MVYMVFALTSYLIHSPTTSRPVLITQVECQSIESFVVISLHTVTEQHRTEHMCYAGATIKLEH